MLEHNIIVRATKEESPNVALLQYALSPASSAAEKLPFKINTRNTAG